MAIDVKQGECLNSVMASLPGEETGHMRRVGVYAGVLARWLFGTIGCHECGCLRKAAAYHDIGKAWIARDILLKPDRLTKEELEILRTHPLHAKAWFDARGEALKMDMPDGLWEWTVQCAVYHHEWFNGSGYPFGLAGGAIPLAARITGVCDAYDAMTSDRVYRKGHTHAFACQELLANAGGQFDPSIVQVFLEQEAVFSQLERNLQATAAAGEPPAAG